mmetsp:Transcript_2212/g.3356  ORF Transcript_2212/g.3356 Transcript_2212/m.3356 type:complete len:118 (-) Transcript_2212:2936-3289(-)
MVGLLLAGVDLRYVESCGFDFDAAEGVLRVDWEEDESVVAELAVAAAAAEVEVANVLPGYYHLDDSGNCSVLYFEHFRHGGCHAEKVAEKETDDIAVVAPAAGDVVAGADFRLYVFC